ncbi:uncharacterized protein [Prorops nasuta]|uniref:uncharacterized protein isoform X2 n=1 Tax=Prorops nasuta TaxID=863751 RepID=UPI0034CEA598
METGTRFLPINSKSKICCSVFNCNSKAKTNPELSFHHFPEAGKIKVKYMNKFGQYELIDRRLLWIRVLKMGKKVTKTMRVCSLHFVAEDYTISPDSQAGARSLKKSSIPSVNLPQSSIKSSISYTTITQITARKSRLENRIKKGLIRLEEKKEAVNCDCFLNKDEILIEEENQMEQNSNNVNVFVDFGVQVTSGDLLLDKSFLSLLKTDTELSTATGIETFELLNSIITAVEIAAPHLKIHNSILNISERVLLTFIKLKQNVSYSFLSLLFPRVNVRYCKEIICNMLDILFEILNPCIHYPSRNEILKNIPLCFAGFADTQIILDCTEIEIQKPKNLCCQITTYSNYKGRYTVKFMTGVTPGGIISFVSSAYGGRASDKAIFEQSKLLQQLEKEIKINS